jgi:hypothetical protein
MRVESRISREHPKEDTAAWNHGLCRVVLTLPERVGTFWSRGRGAAGTQNKKKGTRRHTNASIEDCASPSPKNQCSRTRAHAALMSKHRADERSRWRKRVVVTPKRDRRAALAKNHQQPRFVAAEAAENRPRCARTQSNEEVGARCGETVTERRRCTRAAMRRQRGDAPTDGVSPVIR